MLFVERVVVLVNVYLCMLVHLIVVLFVVVFFISVLLRRRLKILLLLLLLDRVKRLEIVRRLR